MTRQGVGKAPSEWRQVAAVARLEMSSYFRSWVGVVFALFMPSGLLLIAINFWYPEDARAMAVPDMAVLSVLTSGLFSIGVAITEQRKEGTLKTYLSSPLRARSYIAAQVIDRVVVTLVGNAVMVLVAGSFLGITAGGSLIVYAFVGCLALGTMLSFGFLLASRFKSVETAATAAGAMFLAITVVGGVFVDTSKFPSWAEVVIGWLPFKPIVESMRTAWDGASVQGELAGMALITGWLLVFLASAAKLFRWTPSDR